MAANVSADFHAEPIDDNLFEWHFTLRGPPEPSAFSRGIYHGRVDLPATYPLRPPSFRFLTPSGRFEVNREICLSISGYHEETWQPAWGIRTALVAIRSFMDSEAAGQVGGMTCNEATRKRLAGESGKWTCATCSKCNDIILAERVAVMGESETSANSADVVPAELRLAYRDELSSSSSTNKKQDTNGAERKSTSHSVAIDNKLTQSSLLSSPNVNRSSEQSDSSTHDMFSSNTSNTTFNGGDNRRENDLIRRQHQLGMRRLQPEIIPAQPEAASEWVDKAIFGVFAALILMVLRKLMA